MMELENIKNFYPPYIAENKSLQRYMLKEYILILILDYLTTTPFIRKITFIGGTNLRLTKGIDRFSEDLDFDCKDLSEADFIQMTNGIALFLKRYGFHIEVRDKFNEKLKAFRRSIYFPEFLFELGLSGYRKERFLIKIETEDQKIDYEKTMATVKGCGFYFLFPAPADAVLCAMKITALLSRQKGRDFYDVMFLLQQTQPDFKFLTESTGIQNRRQLKTELLKLSQTVDLTQKAKDFEHLVFHPDNVNKILRFKEFISGLW